VGIQKKLERASKENELWQIAEVNVELQTKGQMEPVETMEQNCRCVRVEQVNRWPTACELEQCFSTFVRLQPGKFLFP